MEEKLYRKPTSFWKGKKVVTLQDIRNNGGQVIPKGTVCEVRGKYRGFDIRWNEKNILIRCVGCDKINVFEQPDSSHAVNSVVSSEEI